MRLEYIRLCEDIKRLSGGKPILYIANPGNWGDALIRQGALYFFQFFGIEYTEVFPHTNAVKKNALMLKAKMNDQLIVLAGSGAWCGHYRHSEKTLTSLQSRYNFSNVLVLPSTYQKNYKYPGVHFYRRDKFESAEAMPDAKFCHDMAFFLSPILGAPEPSKSEANIFRLDVEASGSIDIPADNHDLSLDGEAFDDVWGFFNYLSEYEVINTDRLHVAIGSSMLGKTVNLYLGSYFKNRAIYLSSIKGYYPNITIHE